MSPAVRTSRAPADQLLDPQFVEVGASGRRWDRQAMLSELPDMQGGAEAGPQYVPADMKALPWRQALCISRTRPRSTAGEP
ncbi:hypothetical protein ACWC3Y_25360 [Streptomyces sp. NPDC001296]